MTDLRQLFTQEQLNTLQRMQQELLRREASQEEQELFEEAAVPATDKRA
jgi:hypothetical protein